MLSNILKRFADIRLHIFHSRSGSLSKCLPAVLRVFLLLICSDDPAGRIHDRTHTVLVEEREQILALTALRAIAGHKDISLGHDLAQDPSHLRVGGADYRAHIAVFLSHKLFAPGGDLLSDQFIQRPSVNQTVLELPARWIRGLHQELAGFESEFDRAKAEGSAIENYRLLDMCIGRMEQIIDEEKERLKILRRQEEEKKQQVITAKVDTSKFEKLKEKKIRDRKSVV